MSVSNIDQVLSGNSNIFIFSIAVFHFFYFLHLWTYFYISRFTICPCFSIPEAEIELNINRTTNLITTNYAPPHSGIVLSWMVLFHLLFSTQCPVGVLTLMLWVREVKLKRPFSPHKWRRLLCSRHQLVSRMARPPGDRAVHWAHHNSFCQASLGWIAAGPLPRIIQSQCLEGHWRISSSHTEHMTSWDSTPTQKVEVAQ